MDKSVNSKQSAVNGGQSHPSLRPKLTEDLLTAFKRGESNSLDVQEIAMEAASYAGFCKDPQAIAALEAMAYDNAMETFINEAKRGLYITEEIYSAEQVKEQINALLVSNGYKLNKDGLIVPVKGGDHV